ncbi:tRNA lysidine(34) synthetase TilS [Candidatus Mycoplasma pogonae]
MKSTKKILLAVSGGPDSMFLLNYYKDKNIVVAHVNYQKRIEADAETELIKEFCKNHNIPLFIKIAPKKKIHKNFQAWARELRYEFFHQIYQSQNCEVLLTAHHKDDYIETYLLQKQTKRKPMFWAMQQNQKLYEMQIYRPLLHKYWKHQILQKLAKDKIIYGIDISNFETIYTRNAIRKNLSYRSQFFKTYLYWKIRFLNIGKSFQNFWIQLEFQKWETTNFAINYFNKSKKKDQILFIFLNKNIKKLKLNSKKLYNIKQFINSNTHAKQYILNDHHTLIKQAGNLIIKKTN